MNTTAGSLSSSLTTEYPWRTPRSRAGSALDARRSYEGLLKHYVLASESPLNSDDDRESVLSIQAKETDYVQDTSDTDSGSESEDSVEYEPATEPEDAEPPLHASDDTSGVTDSEIISTKVISVAVADEGDLEFADSEQSEAGSDPELGPHDYWRCAQCRAANNNPLYRYCEKCFKVRKNFFPPRPKRKSRHRTNREQILKLKALLREHVPSAVALAGRRSGPAHSDSCGDSAYNSQEFHDSPALSQEFSLTGQGSFKVPPLYVLCRATLKILESNSAVGMLPRDGAAVLGERGTETGENVCNVDSKTIDIADTLYGRSGSLKRRAVSVERPTKRRRRLSDDSSSDGSDSDGDAATSALALRVQPVVRTSSDPLLTIDALGPAADRRQIVSESESSRKRISKKALVKSLKEKLESVEEGNVCIVCCSEPKSGVFVHGRIAHICCCYRCAVKVWTKAKRCPVCNCKVSNVLKAVVM